MVPPFEKAMQRQKVGVIGEPIKSQFGWHIILVEKRKDTDNTKEFYALALRKKIYQRKFTEEAENWVRRVRDASYVEIMLPDNLAPFNNV